MDYLRPLRPLFVYLSHLACNQTDSGRLHAPLALVREDLQAILLGVFRDPAAADGDFDEAWYAVRCWLGEALAALPGGGDLRRGLIETPENGGSEFFARLKRRLDQPGRADLVQVYAACLELGFKGYYARPGHEGDLAGYRDACRARLAEAPDAPVPVARRRDGLRRAAVWVAPAAATAALYCAYRYSLQSLFALVVG